MSKNGFVKVRCFPISTISDLQWHYMQPLISKKPSTIIHIGTNDAGIKEATADKIIDKLLELKKEVENKLPEATIVISTLLKRNDKVGAGSRSKSCNIDFLKDYDKETRQGKDISNLMNEYFCSIGKNLASKIEDAPNPLLGW